MTDDVPGTEQLVILDPTADRHGGAATDMVARPPTLENLTIGLMWNGKAWGDVALKRVGEMLKARYQNIAVNFYSGWRPSPAPLMDQIVQECDVVIGCTADCGSCTSWMAHDVVQLERREVPSVIIASAGFEHDLEASARAFAMPDINYVVVPKSYNNLDEATALAQTEPVVDDLIALLTAGRTANAGRGGARGGAVPVKTEVIAAENGQPAFERFNDLFLDRDWSDGYPIWPPTNYRVDRLVEGVDADPEDVVCLLPPGNGEATLRKVAINAAMAGCQPQDMPVVVAALRAIANMRPIPRSPLMSTSAHAPLVLVNGPITKQLGINGGRACLGPGKQNKVNIRISRAIVMCLKNLGSWYPGVMDMDTIGTTRKHIVVVAENEDESPWEPYHVSKGFAAGDNTVTVFFTCGEWDISIQGHIDVQQLAEAIASFSGGNNGGGYFNTLAGEGDSSGSGRVLFLPPPHAIPLKEGGFTKAGLENFMFLRGQEPIAKLRTPIQRLYQDGKVKAEWDWVFRLSEEEALRQTLPVIERPELYSIVVVGSVRAKDLLMPTRVAPHTELVTSKLA